MAKLIALFLLILSSAAFTSDRVGIAEYSKTIQVEMKYNTSDNFMARRLKGYSSNTCMLARPAAIALAEAQKDFERIGFGIKVFDCYRPQEAVDDMHSEILQHRGEKLDPKYVPNVDKTKLIELGYVAKKSRHTLGIAVDLTLVDLKTGEELDMGTIFDLFDSKSWTADTTVSRQAQKNRALLVSIMEKHGFQNFEQEWWHFDYMKQERR